MLKMGIKGIWKILAILMVFVLAMVVVMPSAAAVSESDGNSSSTTIYVPDDYPTIQAAVDAASAGDTIIVRDGTYRENIDVNKRLTIKSENGSGNCIVEAEDRDDSVFEVTAGYVNITGFTVKGTSGYDEAGIYLYHSDHCSISNNICSNNDGYGIYLDDSENNRIYLNNFVNNGDNVHSYRSTNTWNSPETITYTYNGSTYAKYLGNYWSDYTGNDTNNDGIGDTPYSINSNNDIYPLIQPWENYFVEENGTNTKSETTQFAFSSYYQPIDISVNLNVPPYQLPLTLSNIAKIEDITAKLGLNKTEEELLEKNGFVILDYGQEDDIVAPYKYMKDRGIPIFVTTDTLLHLYHIQFNEILKGIEEREFFDEIVDMSNAMLNQSVKDYDNFDNFTDPELKESARRNVAYFAVALKLLQTATEGYNGTEDIKMINLSIPDYVTEDVNNELENITQHDGFHPSAIFNSDPNCICDYPCCYCEDYSHYVPRGHYTRSEQLKRYFKAMMWYGRMAFMLKGCNGDDALISNDDADLSTMQAALIASELPDVTVNNSIAQEIWDRIYTVTAFFVGTADDLTPYEYRDALNIVFGTAYNASDLSDEDKLLELKVELAKLRSPEIYPAFR
jgi:parallel beta-helix repeat protein